MSKMNVHRPTAEHVNQPVPMGKRLLVRDAAGRRVMAFEPGQTPDQKLPPGCTTELVDVRPVETPSPVDPFGRIPSRIAIEALMELTGVSKTDLVTKAQEIRGRGRT